MMPSSKAHCEDDVKECHLFTQQIFRKLTRRARAVLRGEESCEHSEPGPHGEDILMGGVKQEKNKA